MRAWLCSLWMVWVGAAAHASPLDAPGVSDVLRRIASLVEQGRTDEAQNLLEDMLRNDPSVLGAGEPPERRLRLAVDAADAGDLDRARATLKEVARTAPGTEAGMLATRLLDQLGAVGRAVADVVPSRWVRGEPVDLKEGRHLVLFFEAWCPHCRSSTPDLVRLVAGRADVGLVGFTRMSRGTTPVQLASFLDGAGFEGSVGLASDPLADRFGVTGVPAAALVEDGVIRWRGHPAQVTDALLTPPAE